MPTLSIYPSDDGYINNVSGIYPTELTNISSSTSSSNAVQNTAYLFFDTRDVTTGLTGATITALTLKLYGIGYSDPFAVAQWVLYTDQNEVWGRTLDSADPMAPGFGTFVEGFFGGLTVGIYNDLTVSVAHMGDRTSKFTNFAVYAALGDVGPAYIEFGTVERANIAERSRLDITYTAGVTNGASFNQLVFGGR